MMSEQVCMLSWVRAYMGQAVKVADTVHQSGSYSTL